MEWRPKDEATDALLLRSIAGEARAFREGLERKLRDAGLTGATVDVQMHVLGVPVGTFVALAPSDARSVDVGLGREASIGTIQQAPATVTVSTVQYAAVGAAVAAGGGAS